MDGKGIKIRFEADETPIRSALVRVEKSVKSIAKDLKEVDKLLELDPDNINLLTQKQEQLGTAITRTTQNLQAMEKANDGITKGYQKWQKNQETIEKNAVSIQKMTDELNSAKAAMQAMVSAGGNDIKFTDEYAAAVNNVEALSKAISDLEKEQGKLKMADPEALPVEVYQKYQRDVEALRINLKQLEQQQTEVTSAISAGGLAAQKLAAQEQERMRVEQQAAAAEAEKAKAAEETARAAEEQAKAEEERKAATERAAAADKQAKKASEDYKGALDKLKTAANNVKNDIQGMAAAVATGITAVGGAVAAGTTAVTKTGMEFTKSMSNVQALSGAVGDELKSLRDAASEAGANTSKTASEAADALGFMALAGWDSTQMLEGLMPVLRASEAGTMDLATCSDLVTDSMSAMGIAVGDLQHYLDVCAKTQSSANTSMQELLEAYVECGGMLNQLNVPLETSAALLGTLANRGIKGSEAGKALNSILVNLIGANKNAASALKDMDASAFDAQGRFIGLEETLKLVKSRLDEYGDNTEKITQLESKLGGKTQLDTLMALLSGVGNEYDSLNGKIQNCNGSLEATAKTMQDNLSGDITSLQSALEGVENTIFNSLEAPFRDAAQNVTKELRDLNAACSEGELADSLKRSAEALSGFISKMAAFAADTAFPTLIKWLEWVANHADAIISSIKGMGVAWASWKLAQYVLHLKELVDAIKLVKTAQTAATVAQTGLAASAATAAASEEALAAAAKTVAMAHMLAVAAVAALTVAVGTFIAKQIDAASEALSEKNALDETTQAIYNQANAYADAARAAEENSKKADEGAETAKRYWKQVQNLVDADGRATGSTDELKSAVARLNEAAGTNIEVVNGQISGYKELVETMDDYIERTRRESKLSYLQDGYGEAVTNIENVTAQYEQALEDRMSVYENYREKQDALSAAEERYHKNFSADTYQEYSDAKKAAEEAGDQLSQASIRLASLSQLKTDYEKTMEEYEDLLNSPLPSSSKTKEEAIKEAAEAEGKRIAELNCKNAELVKLGVKQTWEELETSLADLDAELAIKNVSEDDFWAKRRKLLEDSQYKESADWWNYYDEVTEHYEKLSETERKAQEASVKVQEEADKKQQEAFKKSIDDQVAAVKEKQELNSNYTKEMMYDEIEIIISGLDKESELYKKYNSEVLKGRRDLDNAQLASVAESVKEIQSKYSGMLKEVAAEQESYKNKLLGMAQLYSSETKTDDNGNKTEIFNLENIDAQIKAVEEYDNKLKNLESRGAGKGLVKYIESLSQEDADNVMHVLGDMTDSELKAYSDKYDKLIDTVNERAEARFAPQVQEVNDKFIEEVYAVVGTMPNEMQKLGMDAIDGFIKGFTGKNEDLVDAVTEKCNSVIDGLKNGLDIHSPSKETEEIGKYAGEGFEKGLMEFSGAAAAEEFTDEFIAKIVEKDKALHDLLYSVFAGNTESAITEMNAKASEALNGIIPSLALPDITQFKLPKSSDVTLASNSNTAYAEDSSSNSQIVSLLQNVTEYLSEIYSILSVSSINRNTALLEMILSQLNSVANKSYSSNGSTNIERLIRELNKPLPIYLDRNKIGEAALSYMKEYQRKTGW